MPNGSMSCPSFPSNGLDAIRHELEYRAYQGRHAAVYERYKKIPERERRAYRDAHILNSIVAAGIDSIGKARTAGQPAASVIDAMLADVEQDLELFMQYCASESRRPSCGRDSH